jgi:predicted NBD/HSP70 family sugar kinase
MRERLVRAAVEPTLTARERLILNTVRRQGETTRARLIQLTGLTGPAVFRATEDLARRGLLLIGEPVAAGRGQPSHVVRLRADACATLGLAVMTDHAEAVLMDFTGAIRASRDVGVAGMARAEVVANAAGFLRDALAETAISPHAVLGVGLSIAGFFTGQPGAVNPAAELDDWALIDLGAAVGGALDTPILVENIANAAAVGERMLGVGAWAKSFVYFNFAHGFGSGLILNGELARGSHGNAGELGAIMELANLPSPSLSSLRETLAAHGVETAGVDDLVTRFQLDWPGVEAWIAAYAPTVSFLANAMHYAVDCDAIVLGGRLPRPLGERLIAEVRWLHQERAPRRGVPLPTPKVVCAEVASSAAAVGAAALLLQRDYFA